MTRKKLGTRKILLRRNRQPDHKHCVSIAAHLRKPLETSRPSSGILSPRQQAANMSTGWSSTNGGSRANSSQKAPGREDGKRRPPRGKAKAGARRSTRTGQQVDCEDRRRKKRTNIRSWIAKSAEGPERGSRWRGARA